MTFCRHPCIPLWCAVSVFFQYWCPTSGQEHRDSSSSSDVEAISRILDDWETRQNNIRRIKYHLVGTKITPRGHAVAGRSQPSTDTISDFETTWFIDFEHYLIRKEDRGSVYAPHRTRWQPVDVVTIYDGHTLVDMASPNNADGFIRGDAPRDVSVRTDDWPRGRIFMMHDHPIFYASGTIWYGQMIIDSISPDSTEHLIVNDFRVVNPRSVIGLDRAEDVTLRFSRSSMSSPSFEYEYIVDPSQDSAIQSVHFYHNGRLRHKTDIQHGLVDSFWLPKHWKMDEYTPQGDLSLGVNVVVESVEVNPGFSDDLFQLELRPAKETMSDQDIRLLSELQ